MIYRKFIDFLKICHILIIQRTIVLNTIIIGFDSTTSGHSASAWTGETGTSYKNLTATVTFTATWKKEVPKTESFSGLIGSSVTPAVKDRYKGSCINNTTSCFSLLYIICVIRNKR